MQNLLNTTLRNVAWFKQIIESDHLQMNPPYQRNIVWNNKQKSFLIDSILKGYPIPEIYMQEVTDGMGETTYIVADGQQRINSIKEFMKDGFPLNKDDSPEYEGSYFSSLSIEQRKSFFSYNFVVRILPEMAEEEIRSIFKRLNQNVSSLNNQELRQAVYSGKFIQHMNEISDFEEFDEINLFSANDRRRMLDAEFISELTIAYLNGYQNKKDRMEEFYQYYDEHYSERDDVNNTFKLVLREIIETLPNMYNTRWRKKTDFYTLFLVFANHKKLLPLEEAKRNLANSILVNFGNLVSDERSNGQNAANDPLVVDYANASRASTDLSSRQKRSEILEFKLKDVFS